MTVPFAPSTPAALGLDPQPLERLRETITGHLAEGRYPGAQIAVARHGKLALVPDLRRRAPRSRARGRARRDALAPVLEHEGHHRVRGVAPRRARRARFTDRVAEHVPGFEATRQGRHHDHPAPDATRAASRTPTCPKDAWEDHDLLRRTVCGFTLEWTPGSRVVYHGRAAHWTAAVMIEALTKTDYRAFIRENITEPLGLGRRALRRPARRRARARGRHARAVGRRRARQVKRAEENTPEFRRAGTPGGGGYATARAMAAFYQMLAAGRHAQRRAPPLAAHHRST